MAEAILYQRVPGGAVRCALCAHRCVIAEGGRGRCGVRTLRGGVLETLTYGRVVASGVDPIEKKPLFHFLPGSSSFSVATVGCNFSCANCQNHEIAQPSRGIQEELGEPIAPTEIVDAARRAGCASIAYTYTEPTVFLEFALDTSREGCRQGLLNVFVSNGFMTREALDAIAPTLDGINIDLKAARPSFYRDVVGGVLRPVLRSIERCVEHGIWVEVTTLVIPGMNDSERELRRTARRIARISPDIPWHISRFFPAHRLRHLPATPIETLRRAADLGREVGLRYVYVGNVPGEGEDTRCPACGEIVIRRHGYCVIRNALQGGCCAVCGHAIPGRWASSDGP
ncbi:MAG: AmmeMemoRadiSam system radical SAM enzyme [Candidatus Bipolaricaulota bacterium]|nr:MAG: AmmeMemoRadiSam system radical SAM enzyme [Candidatus Bipolaricaulota bacterium]